MDVDTTGVGRIRLCIERDFVIFLVDDERLSNEATDGPPLPLPPPRGREEEVVNVGCDDKGDV